MRKNSDQLKDLRLKLDEAIDSGDIVQIQYLYSCATNMSASLPLELMERARLTIALFNAMTTNKIDDIVSYIRQCDELLLGDTIKFYQIAQYFLKIDKALHSHGNTLQPLQALYDEIMSVCPDVPNMVLLHDKIYQIECRNIFANKVEIAVKKMILIDIEDAMIYANKHELTNTKLYSKLERLFNHEQNRRYLLSKNALSRNINFDQVFYEEDKLKLTNYQNGKNNFNDFVSPFKLIANDTDDDDDSEHLSMSWDADLAAFAQMTSQPNDNDTTKAIGSHTKHNENQYDIAELSDEKVSEFSTNSSVLDVDDLLDMDDIVDDFNVETGNHQNAMDADHVIKVEQQDIPRAKIEPFVPFNIEIDELNALLKSLAE
eukprot:954836_1